MLDAKKTEDVVVTQVLNNSTLDERPHFELSLVTLILVAVGISVFFLYHLHKRYKALILSNNRENAA